MKVRLLAIGSGVIWTMIAALILWQPGTWGRIHDFRWIACASGPFFGLAVYYASRWTYKRNIGVRLAWTVLSLYLAAGAYGLLLGLLVWPGRIGNVSPEAIFEPVMACWWGITFIPFLWLLFPLAFLNHQLLRHYEKRPEPAR